MFFSPPGVYPACGMFTVGHVVLLLVTLIAIAAGLWCSQHYHLPVRRAVRAVTALLWLLEAVKVIFVLLVVRSRNPNDFVPLYYCSLVLYAGLFSSLGRGWLQRMGDVFMATGSLVGGACFLFCPNTSLPRYPMLHFISFHSFILHGLMVYLALLMLLRGGERLRLSDIRPCAALVSVMCALAFFFNLIYDSVTGTAFANLMFMSKDFPGTPITLVYQTFGSLYPLVMWLGQAFLPFLLVFALVRLCCRFLPLRGSTSNTKNLE